MTSAPILATATPVAFATKGTVRLARGLTSRTKISPSFTAYWTFIRPLTLRALAIASVSAFSSVTMAGGRE